MTNFAATSKTIRFALAFSVLTPAPLLAEALTARQMLAQAQNQAVMLPGETKQPGNTELAKADIGKAEPAKTADLAPPLPAIAPPATVKSVPPVSADAAAQSRVAGEVASAMPAPDAPKPSIATIKVLPAPPTALTTPALATPAAVAAPEAAPTAENQTRAPQPVADVVPAPQPVVSPAKAKHSTGAPASSPDTSKAPREKLAARRSRGSRAAPSFEVGGSSINARMISGIMQRPEVQSLIAQYGFQ